MANRYAIPVTIGNINGNLIPSGDDTYDIGSATAAWQDLFLEGDVHLSDATTIAITAAAHDTAGPALIISAGDTTAGTTNNIAGGALTIQGGQGKGSGAGGDIIFQTANASGSGSSLNALATALTISDDLSSTFGGSVLPVADDTHDLGSASLAWRDLYIEGDITMSDAGAITAGGNMITLDEDVKIHDGFLAMDAASGSAHILFDNAGTGKFSLGLKIDSNDFFIRTSDGGSGAEDAIRIPYGQLTVDFNATADESAFDDYDDAMVLAAAYSPTAESYELGKDVMSRGKELLAEIGILRKHDDGWLGYSPQRMDALMAGAIYQSRGTIDILSEKVKELEAQVMSLKGEN